MKLIRLFTFGLLICLSFQLSAQQVPDFTLTDLNGNEHKLYEDYLDQGKPVFISFFGVWNQWDLAWVNQGVMDEFYELYGPGGTDAAQIIFLEIDASSEDDELYGNGTNTQGDFVTGHNFPIVNHPDPDQFIDMFEIIHFPYVVAICPGGMVYGQTATLDYMMEDPLMFYGELGTSELMAERAFQNCGVNLLTQFLSGTTYVDDNDNCELDAEIDAPGMMINITNGTNNYSRFSNSEGDYIFPTGDFVYQVSASPPSPSWVVCNGPEEADFQNTGLDEIYIDFGLDAINDCPYPEIDITAPFLRRCFSNKIYVSFCNTGSSALESPVVTVTLDDGFILLEASIEPTNITGQILTFNLADLEIFGCEEIHIFVEVDCDAELGEEHCYDASITGSNVCNGPGENTPYYAFECRENQGAYDPNDKRTFPGGIGENNEVEPETPLKYQIRFQNTGTDTAFNIVVLDTLTENLDLETFRKGASSHPYELQIVNERTLKFIFENIMLPDSNINLEGSNGFVNFFINHVEGLSEGTVISNSAAIYFDFNEPVITDDTWITLMNPSSVKNPTPTLQFSVNPNPISDKIWVNLDASKVQDGTWAIYHSNGQQLLEGAFEQGAFHIDCSSLENGMYMLQMIDNNGNVGIKKLVRQ